MNWIVAFIYLETIFDKACCVYMTCYKVWCEYNQDHHFPARWLRVYKGVYEPPKKDASKQTEKSADQKENPHPNWELQDPKSGTTTARPNCGFWSDRTLLYFPLSSSSSSVRSFVTGVTSQLFLII